MEVFEILVALLLAGTLLAAAAARYVGNAWNRGAGDFLIPFGFLRGRPLGRHPA